MISSSNIIYPSAIGINNNHEKSSFDTKLIPMNGEADEETLTLGTIAREVNSEKQNSYQEPPESLITTRPSDSKTTSIKPPDGWTLEELNILRLCHGRAMHQIERNHDINNLPLIPVMNVPNNLHKQWKVVKPESKYTAQYLSRIYNEVFGSLTTSQVDIDFGEDDAIMRSLDAQLAKEKAKNNSSKPTKTTDLLSEILKESDKTFNSKQQTISSSNTKNPKKELLKEDNLSSASKQHRCTFCNFQLTFDTEQEYISHANQQHKQKLQDLMDDDEREATSWCICDYCSLFLPSQKSLNYHAHTVHGVQLKDNEDFINVRPIKLAKEVQGNNALLNSSVNNSGSSDPERVTLVINKQDVHSTNTTSLKNNGKQNDVLDNKSSHHQYRSQRKSEGEELLQFAPLKATPNKKTTSTPTTTAPSLGSNNETSKVGVKEDVKKVSDSQNEHKTESVVLDSTTEPSMDMTATDSRQTKMLSATSDNTEMNELLKKYCPKLSEKSESSIDTNANKDASQKSSIAQSISSSGSSSADTNISKLTPLPGVCVKSKQRNGEKLFINICKHPDIPPPTIPMTDEKLKNIIEKQDTTSLFRVPMHFGPVRNEQDKSGGNCMASDVVINASWCDESMSKSITFTTFVVHVAMEGLVDPLSGKKLELDRESWTILKNKKYLGPTLIQDQEIDIKKLMSTDSCTNKDEKLCANVDDGNSNTNNEDKPVDKDENKRTEDDSQTCLFCKIPYVSKKEYVEHVNELHRDEVQACLDNKQDIPWCVCEFCSIYLPSKETLNKHTYTVHGVKRAESEDIEKLLDAEDEVANIVRSKYFKPDTDKSTPSASAQDSEKQEKPNNKEVTPLEPKINKEKEDKNQSNDKDTPVNNADWQLKIDTTIKNYFMNKSYKINDKNFGQDDDIDEVIDPKETSLSTSDFMKLEILFALCGKSVMQAFRGSTKQPLPNNCPLCLDLKTNFATQSPMSFLYHVHQKHLDHIKKNKNWRECGACQTYLPSMEVSRHHFKLAHKQQEVYFKPQNVSSLDESLLQNNKGMTDDQRLLEIINRSYNNESKRLTKIFGPLDDKNSPKSRKIGEIQTQKKDIKKELCNPSSKINNPASNLATKSTIKIEGDAVSGQPLPAQLESLDKHYKGDIERREKIKNRLTKVYKLARELAEEDLTISESQLDTLRNIDQTDDDIADYLMSHFQKKIEEKQKEKTDDSEERTNKEPGRNLFTPARKSRNAATAENNRNMSSYQTCTTPISQKMSQIRENNNTDAAADREAYQKLKQSSTPLSAAAKLRAKLLGEKMGEIIHFSPSPSDTNSNVATIGDVTITRQNNSNNKSSSSSFATTRGYQSRPRGRPPKNGYSNVAPSHPTNSEHQQQQPTPANSQLATNPTKQNDYEMISTEEIENALEEEINKAPTEKLKQLQNAIAEQERMNTLITEIAVNNKQEENWVDVTSGEEEDDIEIIGSKDDRKLSIDAISNKKEKDAFTKLKDDFEEKYQISSRHENAKEATPKASKSISIDDANRVFKSLEYFGTSAKDLTKGFFDDDEVAERKKLLASLHQEFNFTNSVASSALHQNSRRKR